MWSEEECDAQFIILQGWAAHGPKYETGRIRQLRYVTDSYIYICIYYGYVYVTYIHTNIYTYIHICIHILHIDP